jgi:hypothetical protein
MCVLVVSYSFLLECSCRADLLVKKGEDGKIIMIREGWKERKEKYHTTSKTLYSLNSVIH